MATITEYKAKYTLVADLIKGGTFF